jgi:hypothetical protein
MDEARLVGQCDCLIDERGKVPPACVTRWVAERGHDFDFAIAFSIDGQMIACATMTFLPLNVAAGGP